ncbi:hypothetical protein D0T84_19060 [Dysgonomonas sp. 521]|uniref:recombinase family protein n=1 Tax=Dysgonomonas sp. 521 TaxID=2302932 RepID=UPI0013D37AE4|nr:recombinase family protein [Dysgonomonas sp. 521]NDV96990.1 hypothetical protein [Dysgonomonas sp. 521]
MEKIAASLLRVSTTQQELDSQKDDIKKVANQYGYEIPENYFFGEKISATKPQFIKELDIDGNETGYLIAQDDSRSLQKLKEACQNPKTRDQISVIFIWEISRLSRNTALLLTHINFFNTLKKPIYFINERLWTLDSITKEEIFQTQMVLPQLAMYAEQEYHKIKERMQRGLRYAFEHNKDRYFGENIAYGFKLESDGKNNYLVVDKVEKEVIEDIFNKYINEGWSFKKIADYLNNKKIPTKDNKLWIDSNISRIVSNKRLIGKRNRSNMTVDSTPIIDEDIYNQAQQVLEDKKLIYGRKERTHNYPLKPLIKCGCCGSKLQGVVSSSRKLYYCKECNINVNKFRADGVVWDAIKDSDTLSWYLLDKRKNKKNYQSEIDELNNLINLNNVGVEDRKIRKDNVLKLVGKGRYSFEQADSITDNLDKEIAAFDKEIRKYRKQINLLEDELNAPDLNVFELEKMIEEAGDDLDKIKNLLKTLVQNINVYNPDDRYVVLEIVFYNNHLSKDSESVKFGNISTFCILHRRSKSKQYIQLKGSSFKYDKTNNEFLSYNNGKIENHSIESFMGSTLTNNFEYIEVDPYSAEVNEREKERNKAEYDKYGKKYKAKLKELKKKKES